jgi:hypothetical protein
VRASIASSTRLSEPERSPCEHLHVLPYEQFLFSTFPSQGTELAISWLNLRPSSRHSGSVTIPAGPPAVVELRDARTRTLLATAGRDGPSTRGQLPRRVVRFSITRAGHQQIAAQHLRAIQVTVRWTKPSPFADPAPRLSVTVPLALR